MVVVQDAAQVVAMPVATPMPPPQHGARPLRVGLTPTKPQPCGHTLEAVVAEGQHPLLTHQLMHINEALLQILQ
ncbi:MAG: hypothetical protein TQ37_06215 [Candidatus Synechococcus spongiarum 15L]|uniref:Uncharacterized protein n=1 Tax=Candidatus Synechococcus spongiarum 15L TaxID=1608419 RepID=A0A0G8AUF4_9SYNE|nr:MAG: hypothetical protein TQ37_06215 [Candidatus Synechococcus spongiarum 15L]